MTAENTPQGHGVAMFRMAGELGQRMLRGAKINNAKPVSDHHPMNRFNARDSIKRSRNTGAKLDETGIYAGKVEPLWPATFAAKT